MTVDVRQIRGLIKQNFKITGKTTIDPVTGDVSCTGNVVLKIESSHLPVKWHWVGGDFLCNTKQLASLAGAPAHVGGSFSCHNNQLVSLVGAPQSVGGDFWCHRNQLTSLAGAPAHVGGIFYGHNNQLVSLAGIPGEINGGVWITYGADLPLLRLLLVKGIKKIELLNASGSVATIINRYLEQGKAGLSACATELIKAGFRGNAKL